MAHCDDVHRSEPGEPVSAVNEGGEVVSAELESLERWARARGYAGIVEMLPEWSVLAVDSAIAVGRGTGSDFRRWMFDPLTALLWANAVECGVTTHTRSTIAQLMLDSIDRLESAYALEIEADRLRADGDPLGEWIAAWLRGECPACDGYGQLAVKGELRFEDCHDCHGHGVLLGAHADAMAAALHPPSSVSR